MVTANIATAIALGGATVAWLTFFRNGRTAVAIEITQMSTRAPITILDGDPRPEPVYHDIEVAVINRGTVAESIAFPAPDTIAHITRHNRDARP